MKNDLETQPQYCPSALCDTKYSKPEIQKILNGQPIKQNDEVPQQRNTYNDKNMFLDKKVCTVCRKGYKPLVVLNGSRLQKDDQLSKQYKNEDSNSKIFLDNTGICECEIICRPCLFLVNYYDRCTRCFRKPPRHIYSMYLSFKSKMQCSECLSNKFQNAESGLLITKPDCKFKCLNCQLIFHIN